jgi:hypothetical protein
MAGFKQGPVKDRKFNGIFSCPDNTASGRRSAVTLMMILVPVATGPEELATEHRRDRHLGCRCQQGHGEHAGSNKGDFFNMGRIADIVFTSRLVDDCLSDYRFLPCDLSRSTNITRQHLNRYIKQWVGSQTAQVPQALPKGFVLVDVSDRQLSRTADRASPRGS